MLDTRLTPEDHPHIHGEYLSLVRFQTPVLGSPPHTWGIPGSPYARCPAIGITPTYMGNTWVYTNFYPMIEDHPHIHGEYSLVILSPNNLIGSPPHTWGIPVCVILVLALLRITPTYMGNTVYRENGKYWARDHPHIHGEYSRQTITVIPNPGSPPHTWGILGLWQFTSTYNRITPTYMGNTLPSFSLTL